MCAVSVEQRPYLGPLVHNLHTLLHCSGVACSLTPKSILLNQNGLKLNKDVFYGHKKDKENMSHCICPLKQKKVFAVNLNNER